MSLLDEINEAIDKLPTKDENSTKEGETEGAAGNKKKGPPKYSPEFEKYAETEET